MKLSKNKAKEQDPVGQKVCGNSTAQPPLPRRVVSKQLRADHVQGDRESCIVQGSYLIWEAHVEFLWNRKLFTDRGFG